VTEQPVLSDDAQRIVAASQMLSLRRLEYLPISGDGSPIAEAQGRTPGDSTSVEGLQELISSIATIGVLQPILVEDTEGHLRLLAGERRLLACRWLQTNEPENPHIVKGIPAVVTPGPISETERRAWEVVENFVRTDLTPNELAGALVFERCALLTEVLVENDVEVPKEVTAMPDPQARWRRLDAIRESAKLYHVGAPWEAVIGRLGIQMSTAKAQQLVRAFSTLPPELSAGMDAEGIAVHSRLKVLKLTGSGREQAAQEIWEAVRARKRPDLLGAAVDAAVADKTMTAEEAVAAAERLHQDANEARGVARSEAWEQQREAGSVESPALDLSLKPTTRKAVPGALDPVVSSAPDASAVVGSLDATEAIEVLRSLVKSMHEGGTLTRYQSGTLRVLAQQLVEFLVDEHAEAA
jgi:ParB family chromosome partitioning protein